METTDNERQPRFCEQTPKERSRVLLAFLETNGIKLRPTNAEVVRVGLAVAAGEMKYQELLDWILENEI